MGLLLVVLASGCGPKGTALSPPALTPVPAPSASGPLLPSITPTGIRIPSIGVDDRQFMDVGLDSHDELQVPPLDQPKVVGFYRLSPAPGDVPPCRYTDGCVGPSVLVGHINGDGQQGVFAKLAQVKKGAEVQVDRGDGRTAVFTVTTVDVFQKSAFNTQSVYGDVVSPSLVLITCGPGELDRVHHNYLQQTVVHAELTALKVTQ